MANDTREDYSQYYPGGGSEGGGGGGSTPVMSDKVDRFTVPDIGLDPSFDEVAGAVRTIIRGVAPVATSLMLVLGAWGETARFGALKSSSTVVVAEDDPVATAKIVTATNAAVETAAADAAAKVAAFADVAATNYETKADAAAKLAAANAETAAATNALAAKIPTVDLEPYAQKSWVEAQGFAKQSSLSGMASEVWVLGLGYVTAAITNGLVGAGWVQNYVDGRGFVTKSVTNGLAGTGWVESYVNGRGFVTKSITNGIEAAAVARAREGMASTDYVDRSIEDAVIAATGSNVAYRLMRENGSGFIDGYGRSWSITNMLGWTKWNNQGKPYAEEGWETGADPFWDDGVWRYIINKQGPESMIFDATWSCAGASNATALVMNYAGSTGDTPSYTGQLTLLLDYQKTNYVAKVTWDNELAAATNATLQAAKDYTDAHSGGGGKSSDGAARPLPPYLHALSFDSSYPDDAAWYYALPHDYGRCSAVHDGGFLYRNYDWKFDDAAEFVVKMSAGDGRFASVGVANVGTNLNEAFVTSGRWSRFYKALPGHTVDGVNERGVVAEVNVVDGAWPRTSGEIHCLGAVRWALDNATSAGMAASNLAAKVYVPQGMGNFHWMLADERETWIVENGNAHKVDGRAAMTNFRLCPERDAAGEGQERYDALMGGMNITSQWWTLAYKPGATRYSDFGYDTNLTLAAQTAWANGSRESHRGKSFGGKTWWQTVHTSIYDITNRTLKVAVQETDDWYVFAVPSAGGASGGITTNDVCNIVTNEVGGAYGDWVVTSTWPGTYVKWETVIEGETGWIFYSDTSIGAPEIASTDPNAISISGYVHDSEGELIPATATRNYEPRHNSLGLVHKDTPTPQVKFAGSGGTNYVLVVEDGKLNFYAEIPDEN